MPKVGNKHFAYTKKGAAQAKEKTKNHNGISKVAAKNDIIN